MMEMTTHKYGKKRFEKGISLARLIFVLGVVLVILTWITEFWLKGYPLTLKEIWSMHLNNPLLFILDFFPLFFSLFISNYSRRFEKEQYRLISRLEERNMAIRKNAEFAQRIGEGDLTAEIEETHKNDVLAGSLLMMRNNLLASNQKEIEQNWISKGKEIASGILRTYSDMDELAYYMIVSLIKYIDVVQGAFYLYIEDENVLRTIAVYAYNRKKYIHQEFHIGQGLIGQAAFEMDMIYRSEIPEDYATITSGLIKDKKPCSILIMPLVNEEKLQGVIEFASIEDEIPRIKRDFIREISPIIAQTLFNLKVHIRTEKEQRMRGQMQALSENSPDMIIRLGLDRNVFYVNPVSQQYTGIKVEELIGKNSKETALQHEISGFLEATSTAIIETREKNESEITIPTAMGERIMHVSGIPEFNEKNEIETILFVSHDITERKQIELEIQEKNKKIGDSINYAKRIQNSILPNTKLIQEYFSKSFIFYKPRDVISGDFPWFFKKNDDIFIAAVDCTGHGVPGALLSFIGYFILNNIVDHDREVSAGEVLDMLHTEVRRTLRQDQVDSNARDGMDIALCKINLENKKLEYSGAHRPLYILRGNELEQCKGNPKAIGGIPVGKKVENDFITYNQNMREGDKIFFFSDGLPDQIGGQDMKKYHAKRIREAIISNSDFSMREFSSFFANDFEQWKGTCKQIDDVLLIGIEF